MEVLRNVCEPTLLLDKMRCLRNIQHMAEKARRSEVSFRPHFKTHQSRVIGRWFRESGVSGIATSSLRMAMYFAQIGWSDITVAFPVNLLEIQLINTLSRNIQLNVLVEDPDVIHRLDKQLQGRVGAYLKIDVGTHRTGIHYNDVASCDICVEALLNARNIEFMGFLAHAGHTYDKRSPSAVKEVYHIAVSGLRDVRNRYNTQKLNLQISYGDTPSCSVVEDLSDVDEIRPGNFVFYDLMQMQIGSCRTDDIAVAMACPVVSVHPGRREFVIYGGAIHFGTESLIQNGKELYGVSVSAGSDTWELCEDAFEVVRLSQEHGVVTVSPSRIAHIRVGDIALFLPVHACMTAHCMGTYLTLDGDHADHMRGAY